MEQTVQLHEWLLQGGSLSLFDGTGAPPELLIPKKETTVLRPVLTDVVRGQPGWNRIRRGTICFRYVHRDSSSRLCLALDHVVTVVVSVVETG